MNRKRCREEKYSFKGCRETSDWWDEGSIQEHQPIQPEQACIASPTPPHPTPHCWFSQHFLKSILSSWAAESNISNISITGYNLEKLVIHNRVYDRLTLSKYLHNFDLESDTAVSLLLLQYHYCFYCCKSLLLQYHCCYCCSIIIVALSLLLLLQYYHCCSIIVVTIAVSLFLWLQYHWYCCSMMVVIDTDC